MQMSFDFNEMQKETWKNFNKFSQKKWDLEKFFKKIFFPKMRLITKFSKNFCFTKRDKKSFDKTRLRKIFKDLISFYTRSDIES